MYMPLAAVAASTLLLVGCASQPPPVADTSNTRALAERITVLLIQGDLSAREGKIDQAFHFYLLAEGLDQSDARALIKAGNLHRTLGNHQLASEAWRLALTRDPGNSAVHESLGFLLLEIGQYAQALHSLETATQLAASTRAVIGMGLACEKLGDFSRALEIYSAALSANPSSVELLTYKARSLMHLGRHGEARLVVSSIVNEPHHATWIVRGDLFAINGEYAAALSAYVQALPQSWSYQRLGEHALRRQDFSDALHYFTSAANSSTEFFSDAERGAAIAREHLRIKRY